MWYLSERSLSRRQGVDERLIAISDLALTISPIDFGIPEHGGLRSQEEQSFLYGENKSNADGYVKISNHQLGKALDFYAFVDGKASWQEHHLAVVAAAHLQAAAQLGHKIQWGGFWQRKKPVYVHGIPYGWDMPHIELMP